MRGKILIVTSSDEPNVKDVLEYLTSEMEESFRINIDSFLTTTSLNFRVAQGSSNWSIWSGDKEINSDEVKSIWYRRPASPQAPDKVPSRYHDFVRTEAKNVLWSLWTSTQCKDILWVNHPLQLYLVESNKPLQLQVASQMGLSIPETLVTTDAKAALAFFHRWQGEVVIKTFGGHILKDDQQRDLAVYTSRVTERQLEDYYEEIPYAPVMFQNYVPKRIELRVTVVGEQVFSCAIHSQDSPLTRDDWRRYDFERVKHEPHALPYDLQSKLLKFMESMGISFGAIDMILTPEGEYVFLEVNPSGQWGWIEILTGLPISKAIAELLGAGKRQGKVGHSF